MIYLQPRKRRPEPLRQALILGGFLIVFLVALGIFLGGPLQGVLQTLARPFWIAEQSILNGASGLTGTFESKDTLRQENMRLKLSLLENRQNDAMLDELRRENDTLKGILGRLGDTGGLLAAVIARPPRLAYDTFVLDAGSNLQVEPGDHVYVLGDVVIGEVTAVYPYTSLATLYSTSGKETDVLIGGVAAVAKGKGGGNFTIELPRSLAVATGTPVSLPGTKPSLFGTIESIQARAADPTQVLYFRNPFSITDVSFVTLEPRRGKNVTPPEVATTTSTTSL